MKKTLISALFLIPSLLFAQEAVETTEIQIEAEPEVQLDAESSDGIDAVSGAQPGEHKKIQLAGISDVPDAKRPKKGDDDKINELNDVDPEAHETYPDIIKFGLDSDVSETLDKMIKAKDVRFVDEVYDLFQETKSVEIRNKILNFFKTIEDPCLEDYAVMVLNDPYDEKNTTVSACFSYIQMAKTKEAVPAVVTLLESDSDEYFLNALETLGKIGGAREAVYLSDYIDNEDLPLAQKQALVRVLGQLHAVETYDKLVELAQDEDENSFIRMYSAEAIGQMGKKEAIPVLSDLFESEDPNLRAYVIKGIANFDDDEAKKVIIQGIKDSHQKVRNEAITAIKELQIKEADEYLIYRAKNDPDGNVKNACYKTLASLNTDKGNEYLLSQITEKKVPDAVKLKVAQALLAEDMRGAKEIAELTAQTVKDDRRKQLRYGLGKEIAKHKNDEFAEVTLQFINHKDNSTIGTGLDMYAKGRYSNCDDTVKALGEKADLNAKSKNQMAIKAAKIIGLDVDKLTEERDKEREAEEAKKNAGKNKNKVAKPASNKENDKKPDDKAESKFEDAK